jgi:hypothetical protein
MLAPNGRMAVAIVWPREGPPQRQDRWRIDGLVRELYGLSEEEIAIVKDAAG